MINVRNLSKSFGKHEVLKHISVSFEKGEVAAVIGPSGSGKSTFLRCLNMLEKPTEGSIFIQDQEITRPKTNVLKIRENIGMVFQHFHLFPHKTVLENITYAPVHVKKESKQAAAKKRKNCLRKWGLSIKKMIIRTVYQGAKAARCDCEGAGDESGHHAV